MAAVYRYWSALVVVAVVVQIGFAGYGAFYVAHKVDGEGKTVNEDRFEDGFGPHIGFGYIVVLLGLILFVIALASPDRRQRWKRSGLLAGLLIVQVVLAWIGSEVPAIGFFHPLNAVVIFVLSSMIAHSAWRGERAVATSTA